MSLQQIDFSKTLTDDQVYDCIMASYSILGKDWISHQWNWMNSVYRGFKDHYKYIIIISLVEKTLQFYDQMQIQYSYDEYYSKSNLYIEKFSISELCERLNLPKETVRRKVLELENEGIIKRSKKKILIDRSSFPFVKPQNQIKITSRYISLVANLLYENKIYSKKPDPKSIENIIKKRFTLCWRWYYRMQIPTVIGYDQLMEDLSTYHIWGTVCMNQAFNYKKFFESSTNYDLPPGYDSFNEGLIQNMGSNSGISAMSISEMTGIPRATIIRKCKYLIKNNFLKVNQKKQYTLTSANFEKILPYQRKIFWDKAKFIRKILNLLVIM